MKLDPNAPAYPGYSDQFVTADDGGRHLRSECGWPEEPSMGLTVRQAMAKDNMASLLIENWEPDIPYCAALAVKAADALIAELNKEQA